MVQCIRRLAYIDKYGTGKFPVIHVFPVFRFDLKPNCWFDSRLFDSRKSVNCLQMHCSKILEHTESTVMGR